MRLETQVGLKSLRIAALAVALGGLFLLYLHAVRRELPPVRIGDITPVMNFAAVRVRGVLASDARRLQSGSVLYVVDDGSGTLPVFFDPPAAETLPEAGSRISVAGRLSVSAGRAVRMHAHAVSQVSAQSQTIPPEYAGTPPLADITAERQGEHVTVRGRVSRRWNPRPGSRAPYRIILADPGGSLEVVHWFVPQHPTAIGDQLEITGIIGLYNNRIQLKVSDATDMRRAE
jgi:hypothetical protein